MKDKNVYETNPVESLTHKGYYYIPNFETIVISPEGKIIDESSDKECPVYTPVLDDKERDNWWWLNQYPSVDIPGYGRRLVHRLLANTFIKCDGDPEELVVNHKSGDKQDYSLDNLEWVTYSENIVHAFKAGLRTDNKPVLVKDLTNGDITEFYSLQAAARFFKVNGGALFNHLRRRSVDYPYKLKWDVIYKGEEWRSLTKLDVGSIPPGLPKPVITVCKETKESTLYESTTHAASVLGVYPSAICLWVKQKRSSKKFNLEVYFLHEYSNLLTDDTIVLEYNKDHYVKREMDGPVRKPIPIRVTNMNTGHVEDWESTESFANSVGTKKSTIQRSMWGRDGRWRYYLIVYIKDNKT